MKEKIIQFGTGNFLRGFVDDFVDILNKKQLFDGSIVIVQPTKGGKSDLINAQNGKYNLFLRGLENGEACSEHKVIESVSRAVDPYSDYDAYLRLAEDPAMRFIVSNTTESGIAFDESCQFTDKPALSFPGKLTQLLFHRFEMKLSGFIILPCELIDNNADVLKECVLKYAALWNLGDAFIRWIEEENDFANTLVDRIVTGFPKDEAAALFDQIGSEDKLLDTAELFHLWVIAGDFESELPLKQGGINAIWTDDISVYKKMKVRILNGLHTASVFPSMLAGIETVRESLENDIMKNFMQTCLFRYILPTLGETEENKSFAAKVLDRFANPFIKHYWSSISLNSVSKYKVRDLPTVTEFIAKNETLPKPLIFSLACLIEYYKNNDIQDDAKAVAYIKSHSISDILSAEGVFDADLSELVPIVKESMAKIKEVGISEAVKWAMC